MKQQQAFLLFRLFLVIQYFKENYEDDVLKKKIKIS